jgi:hypothetical protein
VTGVQAREGNPLGKTKGEAMESLARDLAREQHLPIHEARSRVRAEVQAAVEKSRTETHVTVPRRHNPATNAQGLTLHAWMRASAWPAQKPAAEARDAWLRGDPPPASRLPNPVPLEPPPAERAKLEQLSGPELARYHTEANDAIASNAHDPAARDQASRRACWALWIADRRGVALDRTPRYPTAKERAATAARGAKASRDAAGKKPVAKKNAGRYAGGRMAREENPVTLHPNRDQWEGKSRGVKLSSLPQRELAKGAKHELEHSSSKLIAKRTAADHLVEDPSYYTHLEAMEKRYENPIPLCPTCRGAGAVPCGAPKACTAYQDRQDIPGSREPQSRAARMRAPHLHTCSMCGGVTLEPGKKTPRLRPLTWKDIPGDERTVPMSTSGDFWIAHRYEGTPHEAHEANSDAGGLTTIGTYRSRDLAKEAVEAFRAMWAAYDGTFPIDASPGAYGKRIIPNINQVVSVRILGADGAEILSFPIKRQWFEREDELLLRIAKAHAAPGNIIHIDAPGVHHRVRVVTKDGRIGFEPEHQKGQTKMAHSPRSKTAKKPSKGRAQNPLKGGGKLYEAPVELSPNSAAAWKNLEAHTTTIAGELRSEGIEAVSVLAHPHRKTLAVRVAKKGNEKTLTAAFERMAEHLSRVKVAFLRPLHFHAISTRQNPVKGRKQNPSPEPVGGKLYEASITLRPNTAAAWQKFAKIAEGLGSKLSDAGIETSSVIAHPHRKTIAVRVPQGGNEMALTAAFQQIAAELEGDKVFFVDPPHFHVINTRHNPVSKHAKKAAELAHENLSDGQLAARLGPGVHTFTGLLPVKRLPKGPIAGPMHVLLTRKVRDENPVAVHDQVFSMSSLAHPFVIEMRSGKGWRHYLGDKPEYPSEAAARKAGQKIDPSGEGISWRVAPKGRQANPAAKRSKGSESSDAALEKLGTLAHNRRFTPSELDQWAGRGSSAHIATWLKEGLIEKEGRGSYFPTPKGFARIEALWEKADKGKRKGNPEGTQYMVQEQASSRFSPVTYVVTRLAPSGHITTVNAGPYADEGDAERLAGFLRKGYSETDAKTFVAAHGAGRVAKRAGASLLEHAKRAHAKVKSAVEKHRAKKKAAAAAPKKGKKPASGRKSNPAKPARTGTDWNEKTLTQGTKSMVAMITRKVNAAAPQSDVLKLWHRKIGKKNLGTPLADAVIEYALDVHWDGIREYWSVMNRVELPKKRPSDANVIHLQSTGVAPSEEIIERAMMGDKQAQRAMGVKQKPLLPRDGNPVQPWKY